MASILIFDINKKYLLYKILSKDILKLLITELNKKYGENNENQNLGLSPIPENQSNEQQKNQQEQAQPKIRNLLTDDFIYGYFAPIINSFEISKEMNYVYEYALFNQNQYIIRFTLYDNCLLLCIYSSLAILQLQLSQSNKGTAILRSNLPSSTTSSPTLSPNFFELNKLIYNDYYTNWCSKSIVSLIKYKFGICSDERCFNEIDNELKNLFKKWSKLHYDDLIYFIESIEYLQINEETKSKCDAFIKEFIDHLYEQEQIKSEFDYLDDVLSNGDYDNADEDTDDDTNSFPAQNIRDDENENLLQYFDEIEDFFEDINRINYYLLSYGTKMLFKYDASLVLSSNTNAEYAYYEKPSTSSSNQSNQILDSSSLFMILLEAATFLNYNIQDPFIDESIYSFKSAASTPSLVSIEDENLNNSNVQSTLQPSGLNEATNTLSELQLDNKYRNSYGESFMSVKSASTPLLSQTAASLYKSPVEEFKGFKLNNDEIDSEINNALNQSSRINDNPRNEITDYKKTHCFLRNSNKSYNFYDVLFIRLDTNLCFTLLKLSKMSKYCELITDLDTYLNELLVILNRKRVILTKMESDIQTAPKKTDESLPSTRSSSSLQFSASQQQQQQDETDEMKFLSVFINKLITFFEKLQILKNELNAQIQINSKFFKSTDSLSSSSTLTSTSETTGTKLKLENRKLIGSNLFKFNLMRRRFNSNKKIKRNQKSSKKAPLTYQQQKIEENRLKNQLKLVNNVQLKINQLINNKQFIPSLNLHAILNTKQFNINQLLNNYRNIETQIILLKDNLKNLLFDLFLSNKFTQKQQKLSENKDSSITPSTQSSGSSAIFQLNSTNFMNSVKTFLKKTNLYHYTSFMEVKLKRNLAMSYYWHLLPGLIHFTFINRHDNNCIVPAIETCNYNDSEINEMKINITYRKYLPIIITFLYKYDCTQFQFVDSLLGVVINYFIWFEDKNANYIPVDLNTNIQNQQQQQQQQQHYQSLRRGSTTTKSENFINDKLSRSQSNSHNAYFHFEPKEHYPIGITLKSYYDLLRKICYPNAPNDSLSCYELICIHSSRLDEIVIKDQCERLATILSQQLKRK